VPDLVYAEAANALASYVRAGRVSGEQAARALTHVVAVPAVVHACARLAPAALTPAIRGGTSAYDGFYLALARVTGGRLVTADRLLAERAEDAALLPGALPPG
jgi:predicted nucleic acid-binding protein